MDYERVMTREFTICVCRSRTFMDIGSLARVVASLRHAGHKVNIIPDLCETAKDDAGMMCTIAGTEVVGCHSRAVKALFAHCGYEPVRIYDLRAGSAGEVLSEAGVEGWDADDREMAAVREEILAYPLKQGTDAWYPVIDRDRCIDCGKCHEFCLFGVYSIDGGLKVANPGECKNDCPACARICPEAAVIFPKYPRSPINGGQDNEEEALGLDVKDLYAEALRQRLQHRRRSVSLLKKEDQ